MDQESCRVSLIEWLDFAVPGMHEAMRNDALANEADAHSLKLRLIFFVVFFVFAFFFLTAGVQDGCSKHADANLYVY